MTEKNKTKLLSDDSLIFAIIWSKLRGKIFQLK